VQAWAERTPARRDRAETFTRTRQTLPIAPACLTAALAACAARACFWAETLCSPLQAGRPLSLPVRADGAAPLLLPLMLTLTRCLPLVWAGVCQYSEHAWGVGIETAQFSGR